jgi:hypothetical protein
MLAAVVWGFGLVTGDDCARSLGPAGWHSPKFFMQRGTPNLLDVCGAMALSLGGMGDYRLLQGFGETTLIGRSNQGKQR